MINNYLGKTIKELRKEENISQIELSRRLDTYYRAVSLWESGQREPDLDMLIRIAEYFQVSVDYLLGTEKF